MLKRAIRIAPPVVRFNYYNKYGVRRGASDDEIKKVLFLIIDFFFVFLNICTF